MCFILIISRMSGEFIVIYYIKKGEKSLSADFNIRKAYVLKSISIIVILVFVVHSN